MVTLTEFLSRISSSEPLLTGTEEATRQGAILPVLDYLGWDWRDTTEVAPEYSVSSGRVDYCLRNSGQSLVFIEVKRAGTELESHQEQLLRYSFNEGVPLAVLTDGLVWWFYLPLRKGSWDERRFFSVDIRRVPADQATASLQKYLGRDSVVSGGAVLSAEAELSDRQRAARVMQALPVAWHQLLTEPDELLAELVAEAVSGIAGARPDASQVAEFLLRVAQGQALPVPAATTQKQQATTPKTTTLPLQPGTSTVYTGKTPVAFVLQGTRREVKSWRDVLVGVGTILYLSHPDTFATTAPQIRGKKRDYFAVTAESLFYPVALAKGKFFAEGNLSANDIVRVVRRLLVAVLGSDSSFSIELAV